MARPSAKTLLSITQNDREFEVLAAETYYYVVYQNQPITLRTTYWTDQGRVTKYPKTGYANSASAHRLAGALNLKYSTNEFKVIKI